MHECARVTYDIHKLDVVHKYVFCWQSSLKGYRSARGIKFDRAQFGSIGFFFVPRHWKYCQADLKNLVPWGNWVIAVLTGWINFQTLGLIPARGKTGWSRMTSMLRCHSSSWRSSMGALKLGGASIYLPADVWSENQILHQWWVFPIVVDSQITFWKILHDLGHLYLAFFPYVRFTCLPGSTYKISRSPRKEGLTQTGRHGPCMASSSDSRESAILLLPVPPKSLAVPVSEQPKVPCVQSLQADGAQEWTWLGCPKI